MHTKKYMYNVNMYNVNYTVVWASKSHEKVPITIASVTVLQPELKKSFKHMLIHLPIQETTWEPILQGTWAL